MSEDTENTALDLFGALLTPRRPQGADGSRCSTAPSRKPAACAPPSGLARGHVALAKARIASNQQGRATQGAAGAVPRELRSDPGYIFARIQLLRREEKFAEAAQLMLAAPQRSGPAVQCRRMVDRAAAAVAQDARRRREPHRLSDRARRRASRPRHLQDRAGIHRGLDRAALPERSRDRRAAFCPHRRRQRQPDRAGARRLLAGPRRGGRRPHAGSPRRLRRGGRAIDQLLRPAGARQARPAADRAERRAERRAAAASSGWRSCARCSCSTRSTSARSRSRFSATWATTAIPMRWSGSANSPRATATPAACCCSARPRSIAGCRSISTPIPSTAFRRSSRSGPTSSRASIFAIARQESAFNPAVVSPAQAYGLMQVTPDAGRYVCKKYGANFDLGRMKNDPVYNAALGAAELGGLLEDYRGSYIMTFAGLQCRPRQRQEMDRALRRSARSQGRRGRLGRADSVLRDPQLRAADHGEFAGLSRPVRRRHAASDRGRPASRRRRVMLRDLPKRGGIDHRLQRQ